MLQGHDEDPNAPPTIEEGYSTAMGASNLKFDLARPGAVDMIIAAGMNPHRLGLALLRLRTEWDCSAKPIPSPPSQLRAIAATYPREATGLVLVQKEGEKPGVMEEVTPLAAAQREADAWYGVEMRRLLGCLKSLPMAREGLVHWATAEGIEGAQHVVAAALLWWLYPKCLTCKGVQKKVVEGTGRTSGKPCSKCRGAGEAKVPHGFLGRKVISQVRYCIGSAARDLKDTKRGLRGVNACET